jgi:hypothetical protein
LQERCGGLQREAASAVRRTVGSCLWLPNSRPSVASVTGYPSDSGHKGCGGRHLRWYRGGCTARKGVHAVATSPVGGNSTGERATRRNPALRGQCPTKRGARSQTSGPPSRVGRAARVLSKRCATVTPRYASAAMHSRPTRWGVAFPALCIRIALVRCLVKMVSTRRREIDSET